MSRVEQAFVSDVASVGAARHFAVAAVAAWGVEHDDVALVVSELAANAACHAHSGFQVSLRRDGDAVVVEVTDASPHVPRPGTPEPGAVGGRGLLIVDHVARRWGVELCPKGGKVVWAEIVTG